MRLKSLVAENFVTYRHLVIDNFPESGFIGITGWNFDNPIMGSNAVGKSLFLDMITYGWYGEVVRKKRANIIGPFAKSTTIKIVLIDPKTNMEFSIKRTKGKTSGERVTFIANKKKYTGTPTKVQPIINRTLGINWLTFKNCIIYSDDAASDHFIRVADTKRKEILSEIADILHLRVAKKLVSAELKLRQNELRFVQGRMTSAKEQREITARELERCTEQLEAYKSKTKDIRSQIRKDIKARKEEIKEKRNCKAEIVKLKSEIKKETKRLKKITHELSKYDIAKIKNSYATIQSELYRIASAIAEYKENIEEVNRHGKCPMCLAPATPKTIRRIEKAIRVKIKKQEELQEKETKQRKKIDEIEVKQEEQSRIVRILDKLNYTKLRKQQELEKISRLEAEIKALREKRLSIHHMRQAYQKAKAEAERKAASAEIRFVNLFFREKSLLKQIEALTYWQEKYGPKGIEASFIRDLVLILEEEANKNITELTNGNIQIEISPSRITKDSEKQEIVINVLDGDKPKDFRLYSGGQKNRIEKAISIGLMKLQDSNIQLKLFDEIGKNLSQEGYERLVTLMKMVFSENQIFTATNNSEIKKYFDYSMHIEMKGGESHLTTSW